MSPKTDFALETDLVIAAAERDFARWWNRTDGMPAARREREMQDVMVGLTDTYGEIAGQSAGDYVHREWMEYGGQFRRLPYPTVAPTAAPAAVLESTGWAMQTYAGGLATAALPGVRDRALEALVRHVMQPARDTVAVSTTQARTKFARVAEAGACGFCLMLASRGGVYLDSGKALSSDAAKFHDNCRCSAVQVQDDSELPQSSHDLFRRWADYADNAPDQPSLEGWSAWLYEQRKNG